MNRRQFLRTSAAAGAVVPVLPFLAAPAEAAATSAAVPSVAIGTAPASRSWQWWASFDGGERFEEKFATREEAVDYVSRSGGGTIMEAVPGSASWDCLDWPTLADAFETRHEDDADPEGDGVFADVPKADWEDLEERLKPVLRQWWAERGIASKTHVYTFDRTRGRAKIPAASGVLPNA